MPQISAECEDRRKRTELRDPFLPSETVFEIHWDLKMDAFIGVYNEIPSGRASCCHTYKRKSPAGSANRIMG